MWLFQRLDCQSLVILSTSSLLYLGDTFTKVIKVLPFLDSFNKASGSLPNCKPQISHLIIYLKVLFHRYLIIDTYTLAHKSPTVNQASILTLTRFASQIFSHHGTIPTTRHG